MKIKRTINLLLSVLIIMATVVNEPLSLLSVQAAEIGAQEDSIIEDETIDEITDEPDEEEVLDGYDEDDVVTEDNAINTDAVAEETIEEGLEESEMQQVGGGLARAAGDVAINATNFPDQYFREYLIRAEFDTDNNGILSKAEINKAIYVRMDDWELVTNLKGIEYLTELQGLSCSNNRIKTVNLSKNTKLKTLWINDNALTSLNLNTNTALTSLSVNGNSLKTLDLSKQTQLKHLECRNNGITSLDLSKNTKLTHLNCAYNSISSLNLTANTQLDYIDCGYNRVTSINITGLTQLAFLDCKNNQLTSLNTSSNTNLSGLVCENNKITSLNLTNNSKMCQVLCGNNALSFLEIPQNVNSGRGLEYLGYEGQTGMTASSVSAKATSGKAINVTWNTVAGASGYELYRYDNTYKNWERVTTNKISGTSYSDKDVKLGETYRYKLYAFQETATVKRYLTYAIGTGTSKTTVPVTQRLRTSIASANSITVSWDRVNLVNGYMVYAATSKNGSYKSVGVVTGTSFTHKNLKPGTTYYYKVTSYVQLGPTRVQSAYSTITSRKQIVPKVVGAKVTNRSANSLKLSWKKMGGASGYHIYQATSKKGKYKKVATIKKGSTTTYTVKNLVHKKKYHFKIRAFKTVGKATKTGKYSNIISRKVILAKPILTAKAKSKTAITLKWKKIGGAKEYEIYQATSKKGKYKKIATTKSAKFTNSKLKKNKTYYYKIRAVQKINNKTYRSEYSARKSAKTKK